MKFKNSIQVTIFALIAFTLSSCLKDDCERTVTYINYNPVYKSIAEIRAGEVVNETSRELCEPGKIYFYNNYIFINEAREGVHVIDNTSPESPANIGFISIPGNEDIAIKGGFLYANSYIDLLTIDISDVQNAVLVERTESVFPPIWEDIQNEQVLMYYEEQEITEKMDCETFGALRQDANGGWWGCWNCPFNVAFDDFGWLENSGGPAAGGGGGGAPAGVGGSMARFTIINDYLYVVDDQNLNLFNISTPNSPQAGNVISLGWGIETIFPYQDKLFIGSNSGMFIYDNSTPENPSYISEFQHARACDPVFVKDNYAYVTLRDGTFCEGFNNQLDLVDITDITNPVLEKTFPLQNPHGLSIKGDNLFVCEGAHGVKVFDISNPKTLDERQLDQVKDGHAFDAIVLPGAGNTLLIVGEDGFYQYNFDNPEDLDLMSSLRSTCN